MFLTPASRRSAAVLRENPMAACFEAAYTASPGTGARPASETMLTTWPPCSRIASIALTVPLIVPSALTSSISRRACGVLLPRRSGDEDAGVVDPDRERPGPFDQLVTGGGDRHLVAYVEGAGGGAWTELGGHGRGRVAVEVGHQDVVATVDEQAGDEPPQTATGSGDDGSAAGAHAE